jgi:hypothetical protein
VTPCGLVSGYQRFGGTYRFRIYSKDHIDSVQIISSDWFVDYLAALYALRSLVDGLPSEPPGMFCVGLPAPEPPGMFCVGLPAPEPPDMFCAGLPAPEPSGMFCVGLSASEPPGMFCVGLPALEPPGMFCVGLPAPYNGSPLPLSELAVEAFAPIPWREGDLIFKGRPVTGLRVDARAFRPSHLMM